MPTDREIIVLCLLAVIIWTVRRFFLSPNIIRLIPGPKCTSWLYGHMPQLLLSEEYGEHEFQWQEKYGQVYSIKGCFGEPRLMISDPETAKYIINNSDLFVFGPSHQKIANVLFGRGSVFLARGETHRRLRGIMNPSFSANNVRALLPIIQEIGRKLVDRWDSLGFPGTTVDISPTLHGAALEVMGNAILEYPFNVLTGQSDLAQIQKKMVDSAANPTKLGKLFEAALPYIPDVLFRLAFKLPTKTVRMFQEYHRITDNLSRDLAEQNRADRAPGKAKGFIDGFVNDGGVTDQEIGVHLRTILFAGQDTTGVTLGWILYKLAQMPGFQQDLRQEIQLSNLTESSDYNNMPFLNAIINARTQAIDTEALRMYCAFPLSERTVTEDCVLPLSRPITTITGAQISAIPVRKGQCLYLAIASFNRLNSIWGPDAEEFRPSRWFDKPPRTGISLGPHPSGLAFLGGPGVCLGWRLAILELQVLVAELVGKFVLSLPDNDSVRARLAINLTPATADGVQQLPLHIEHVS
ncbi:cytochrome P450 [Mycena maculata]|uniref:Cytochrome P450 n=1 Tax=Mycena maculata TaxID=230809 RepID=A0AAD7N8I6_9AGAR|nr:cytochrome P450 [Mycena maculata]